MCVFVYVSLECLILLEVTTCIVQSIRRETHDFRSVNFIQMQNQKRNINEAFLFYFIL